MKKFKTSPLKQESLQNLIDTDDTGDLLRELISMFKKSQAKSLAIMQESVDKNEIEALTFEAHKFKSSALNLGAVTLAEMCQELEKNSPSMNENELKEFISALRLEGERTLSLLLPYEKSDSGIG